MIGRTIQSRTMQWRDDTVESSILTLAKTDSSPITASGGGGEGGGEDKALKGECHKIFEL